MAGKISELSIERGKIYDLATAKAKAISKYDRSLALTMIKLKNGLIKEFEGIVIGILTAGDRKILAEGMVWQECLDKEAADGMYKACLSNIEAIKAELNGLQSMNKHLE